MNFKEVDSMKLNPTRAIGLHVRLQKGLFDVVDFVQQLQLSVVQSFLLDESGKYVSCSSSVMKKFISHKRDIGFDYFVHAAYWSSLTNVKSKEFLSLCKESEIALNLESNGIVVHVGATKAGLSKQEQAQYVAEGINELFHRVAGIDVLLENGPHAGRNFGGDFTDFALLNGMIEQKQRVRYCVDTAHAFVYGYSMDNPYELQKFFKLLTDIFPQDSIALLHLNDTQHGCASQIDKHGIPGQGVLGATVLQECMKFELLKNVPIVLELPGACDEQQTRSVLKVVQGWDI